MSKFYPPLIQFEPIGFSTTDQTPTFITTFLSTSPHTYIWGDGTSTVLNSTGETQSYDYGSAGTRTVVARIYQPENLTSFNCSSSNLSGTIPNLSRYPNLQSFYCYTNSLTGSIPDLSKNTELVNFNCESNNLRGNLPNLSNNTKLQDFRCHSGTNNYTGSLPDFSSNTELRYLYIGAGNYVQVPNFTNNTKLIHFYCAGGGLVNYTSSVLAPTITVFNLQTNNLTQSSVDQILADFLTNIASRPNVVITLNGTGNSPPSAAGIATRNAILALKPAWTILVN